MKKSKILTLPFADPTSWSIVISNFIIIFLAVKQGWSLGQMLWIYWTQSVIIGLFTAFKLLFFGAPQAAGRVVMTCFYVLHYGGFHFVYAMFLTAIFGFAVPVDLYGSVSPVINFWPVFLSAEVFFINHLLSLSYYWESFKRSDAMKYMIGSYARVVPMHLTILFGSLLISRGLPKGALILFLLLKTGVDVGMHVWEHRAG